jgi:hypothetical protein
MFRFIAIIASIVGVAAFVPSASVARGMTLTDAFHIFTFYI